MERIEEKIRDKLAERLAVFEERLTLIKKESFLPNDKGTRGFVDILAQDDAGRYVLIEVKRSNAASREAIHEVLKYIEGIKESKSLRNDEILAIIVSTNWEELLVPFSRFVADVSYSVFGYHLQVDENLNPLSATKVRPLILNNERLLSDYHSIRLYTTKENLEKGLSSHVSCFSAKEITDYILLVLEPPSDYRERELESTMQGLQDIAASHGVEPRLSLDELKARMPEYRYMIYSAVQVMSNDAYWKILKRDPSLLAEVQEYAEHWQDEEVSVHLHEYAVDSCEPTPFQEYWELGYPAKLTTKLLDDEGWVIKSVIRGGRLKSNELLTDDAIIGELKGDAGSNKQIYNKNFRSANKASFSQLLREIEKCLADNTIWLSGLKRAISEIETLAKDNDFDGSVHIYNPSNTLLSIFLVTTAPDPERALQWIPSYRLNIEGPEIKRSYFGCLVRNSNKLNLDEVITRFYDGDIFSVVFPLAWGGYESRDVDIAASYGLEYANFVYKAQGEHSSYSKFDGFRYQVVAALHPYDGLLDFVNAEEEFVRNVYRIFADQVITPGFIGG